MSERFCCEIELGPPPDKPGFWLQREYSVSLRVIGAEPESEPTLEPFVPGRWRWSESEASWRFLAHHKMPPGLVLTVRWREESARVETPAVTFDLNLALGPQTREFTLRCPLLIDWERSHNMIYLESPCETELVPKLIDSEFRKGVWHYRFSVHGIEESWEHVTLWLEKELVFCNGLSELREDRSLGKRFRPVVSLEDSGFTAKLDRHLCRHLLRAPVWRLDFKPGAALDIEENRKLVKFSAGWETLGWDPLKGRTEAGALRIDFLAGFRWPDGSLLEETVSYNISLPRPAQIYFPRWYRYIWPTQANKLTFHSVGHEALLVRIVRVESSELNQSIYYDWYDKHKDQTYGKDAAFRYFEARDKRRLETFTLNLQPFLKLKLGCLVLQIKPVPKKRKHESGNSLHWDLIWNLPDKVSVPEEEAGWDSTVLVVSTGRCVSKLMDEKTNRPYKKQFSIPGSKVSLEPKLMFDDQKEAFRPRLLTYCLTDRHVYGVGMEMSVTGWVWKRMRSDEFPVSAERVNVYLSVYEIQRDVEVSPWGQFQARCVLPQVKGEEWSWRFCVGCDGAHQKDGLGGDIAGDLRLDSPAPGVLTLDGPLEGFRDSTLELRGWRGIPEQKSGFTVWIRPEEKTPDFLGWESFYFGKDQSFRPQELLDVERYSLSKFSNDWSWGIARFHESFPLAQRPGRPLRVKVSGATAARAEDEQASDERGPEIQKQWELMLHPAEAYLGLRPVSLLLSEGESFQAEVVTLNPGGQPYRDCRVSLTIGSEEVGWDGERVHHPVRGFGLSKATARATDGAGRFHQWEFSVYKLGAETPGEFCLHLDRLRYSLEDTGRVVFCCPYPGRAFLRVGQRSAREIRALELKAGEHVWDFEILETYLPLATVMVDFLYFDEFGTPQHIELSREFEVWSLSTRLFLQVEQDEDALSARICDHHGDWVSEAQAALRIRQRIHFNKPTPPPSEPVDSFRPQLRCAMDSSHSWSKSRMWRGESLFEEVRTRARRREAGKPSTNLYPPFYDMHFEDEDIPYADLRGALSPDVNGLLKVPLNLPQDWGVYDISLVVVSNRRAGAVWNSFALVGPVLWVFEPPPVLIRGETTNIEILLEATTLDSLPLVVTLEADGAELLEPSERTLMLQPEVEQKVVYSVLVGDSERAHFRCKLLAACGEKWLRHESFVIPKPVSD